MIPYTQPRDYNIRWLVLSLGIVLAVVLFPYLFGGKTFLPVDMIDTLMAPFNAEYSPPQAHNPSVYDGMSQTLPYKVATQEAWREGKMVYWNPHILAGYPQYAESMGNNYDFLNILLLAAKPEDVILLETFIELLIAGIGMILLLRYLGVRPGINLIFASAYMLNSLFIASAEHRWTVASFCWMPFIVLMILRYYQSNRAENLFYCAIFLALGFLGGNFQSSFFLAFVAGMVLLLYPQTKSGRSILRRVSIALFVGGTSFVLSALMWFPTLELLFQGIFHGGQIYSTFISINVSQRLLSIPLLANFFLPGLLGSPEIYSIKKLAGASINDFNGSIGFLPMVFALWGSVTLWKSKTIRPFILIAALGIVLPIATPLYSILYHRFFIVATFSFCIIGSVSLQRLMEDTDTRIAFFKTWKWVAILTCLLISILLAASGYIAMHYQSLYNGLSKYILPSISGSAFGPGNRSWMIDRIAKTLDYYAFSSSGLWLPVLATFVMLLGLFFYIRGKLSHKLLLTVIFFGTVLQLGIFARIWFPSLDTDKFPIYPSVPIVRALQIDSSNARYYVWRNYLEDPYILPQNSSTVYHTNDVQGFESCTQNSFHVLYKHYIHPDSIDLRLLGLANVKYVVTGRRILNSPNVKFLRTEQGVSLYENLLSKPRAFVVYKYRTLGNDREVEAEMLRPDFDGTTAIFTRKDKPDIAISDSGISNILYTKTQNEEVDLTVTTTSMGLLILSDSYYPGWKCYVNGIPKRCLRVNEFMRGVVLDPGRSEVRFRFEPDVFKAGVGLSAVGLFFMIGGIVYYRRKKGSDS